MNARARKPVRCPNPRRIRVGFRLPGIVDDGLLTLPSADLRECPRMADPGCSADARRWLLDVPCQSSAPERPVRTLFGGRAHQGGIAERKAMIDRDAELPIKRQAELLGTCGVPVGGHSRQHSLSHSCRMEVPKTASSSTTLNAPPVRTVLFAALATDSVSGCRC